MNEPGIEAALAEYLHGGPHEHPRALVTAMFAAADAVDVSHQALQQASPAVIEAHRPVLRAPESKHEQRCKQCGEVWPCTTRALAVERDGLRTQVDGMRRINASHFERMQWLDARNWQLRRALETLVRLKDGPRDDSYRAAKDDAWESARSVLSAAPDTSEVERLRVTLANQETVNEQLKTALDTANRELSAHTLADVHTGGCVDCGRRAAQVMEAQMLTDRYRVTLADIRALHAEWLETIRTESVVMTTAQRNAWIGRASELGALLGDRTEPE